MILSALIKPAKGVVGRSAELKLTPQFKEHQSRFRVTVGAVAAAGGISRVDGPVPEGLQTIDGLLTLPSIGIRTVSGHVVTVLMAESELAGLGKPFKLAAKEVSGAYFRLAPDSFLKNGIQSLRVAPGWGELLQPEWRAGFLASLEQPAAVPLPEPRDLPWQVDLPPYIYFPGLPPTVHIMSEGPGRLALEIVDGQVRAHFRPTGKGARYSFVLQREKEGVAVRSLQVSATIGPTSASDTYDQASFRDLTGEWEKIVRTSYDFSRTLGAKSFCFPYFGGTLYLNQSKKIGYQQGVTYYFSARRQERSLFLAMYADPARQAMIGWGRYNYDQDGAIRVPASKLQPPAECPPGIFGGP